jgi:hypothetical protein
VGEEDVEGTRRAGRGVVARRAVLRHTCSRLAVGVFPVGRQGPLGSELVAPGHHRLTALCSLEQL